MTTERTTSGRFSRQIGFAAALAVATAAGVAAGWWLKPDRPDTALVPPQSDSREAVAERNAVWRVWNGNAAEVPDGPAKMLAFALKAALAKDSPVELRDRAIGALMNKSVLYFTPDEIEEVMAVMIEGEPADRADILRRILAADTRAGTLVRSILADKRRVALFTAGEPIPLETLADGSTP